MDDKVNPIEFLKSINYSKEDLMTEDTEKSYVPYLINHFLSGTVDTVLYANEMNKRQFMDVRMQYDYLRLSVRKNKRFSKWLKKEKLEKIETLKTFFNYSTRRAEEISQIISEDDLEQINKSMQRGGIE